MSPLEFVANLRATVLEENVLLYRELFETAVADSSDPYWRRALELYTSLSPEHKKTFLEVIRQVAVDTTANLLGIMDGAASFPRRPVDFTFTCEGKKLNGDLADLFLAEEQRCSNATSGSREQT